MTKAAPREQSGCYYVAVLAPRNGRAVGLLLAPVLLMSSAACGPRAQTDASQPAPSTSQQAPATGDVAGTAHTPDGSLQAPGTRLESRYQAILDRHNQLRAKHCAPPLRWSESLQKLAQDWADKLRDAGCAFEHRPNNRAGENLTFFAPPGSQRPEDVAQGWYSEVSLYNFAKGDFDFRTGHFTQLVWRGTQHLGCGVSTCNGGELWVCNYDPPGNMMGSFPQHVQPSSCSK